MGSCPTVCTVGRTCLLQVSDLFVFFFTGRREGEKSLAVAVSPKLGLADQGAVIAGLAKRPERPCTGGRSRGTSTERG